MSLYPLQRRAVKHNREIASRFVHNGDCAYADRPDCTNNSDCPYVEGYTCPTLFQQPIPLDIPAQ